MSIPLWKAHVAKWRNCRQCELCDQRHKIVLGRGTTPCDVLFVGEAPGDNENLAGQPFVGPAGALLDQIVERSVGSFRLPLTAAFTNIVACYPAEAKQTNDHKPTREQIVACSGRLAEMIDLTAARLVVAVGSLAENNLPAVLGMVYGGGIVKDHKTVRRLTGIQHPSYILSRLPMAQKGMAVDKCIVVINSALEGIDWS